MSSLETTELGDSDVSEEVEERSDSSLDELDLEYFLLVPVIVISALYMYDANSYPFDARLFPQATALLTFLLSVGVFLRKLSLQSVARNRARARRAKNAVGTNPGALVAGGFGATKEAVRTYKGFTIASSFAFLIVTPVVGLIITAPIFTFVYLLKFDFSKVTAVALSLVVLAYVYAIMIGLNLQRYLGGILF